MRWKKVTFLTNSCNFCRNCNPSLRFYITWILNNFSFFFFFTDKPNKEIDTSIWKKHLLNGNILKRICHEIQRWNVVTIWELMISQWNYLYTLATRSSIITHVSNKYLRFKIRIRPNLKFQCTKVRECFFAKKYAELIIRI